MNNYEPLTWLDNLKYKIKRTTQTCANNFKSCC